MAFDVIITLLMYLSTILIVQLFIWTYLAIPALVIVLIVKAIQKLSR